LFYVTSNILLQQAIGDQHGDESLSTEESHDSAQSQPSHFQSWLCGSGTSESSHHIEEEGAARYQRGYHQLPYESDDENQASGWSWSFSGIRQGGGQTIGPQGGQFHNRLNAPVEEEGSNNGYRCGYGVQDRVTSTRQKEQITENCCGTQELEQLSNETLRRRVVVL